MADVVDTETLKEKLDGNEDFHLVDVLSKESYEGKHIPGAVNVPFSGDNFPDDLVEKTSAKKDDEIIVYCSSETCRQSPNAAKKLEETGFTNVKHFKWGLAGWQEAGFDFEGKIKD